MKHIKSFETYNPVNELTGALVDRARKQAEHGDHGDQLSSEIGSRQADKFRDYVNPQLLELAEKFNFSITKINERWFQVNIPSDDDESLMFYIDQDGELNNFTPEEYDSNMLRKIKKFQQAVINDYNQ